MATRRLTEKAIRIIWNLWETGKTPEEISVGTEIELETIHHILQEGILKPSDLDLGDNHPMLEKKETKPEGLPNEPVSLDEVLDTTKMTSKDLWKAFNEIEKPKRGQKT